MRWAGLGQKRVLVPMTVARLVEMPELLDDPPPLTGQPPGPPRQPWLVLIVALLTVLSSMAICAAAILAPAPGAVVPLVVATCVGAPLFATWEAPGALAFVRAERSHRSAVVKLRRVLDQLPEVEHPLGD
jgi:hypothetical protein